MTLPLHHSRTCDLPPAEGLAKAIEPALRDENGQDHDDPAHDLLRDVAALSGIEGDARSNPVMKEHA